MRPIFAILAAAVLWGTSGTSLELGPDAATPLGVGALRIVVGAAALWVLAGRADHPRWRDHALVLVVAGFGVAGYQSTFFTATERSGVALGTIVALGSGPVFAGILDAAWFRRPPSAVWARATAVAVTGGALLVAAQGGSATLDAVGIACALAAGASYAVYAIAVKALIEDDVDSTMAMAAAFSVGAVVLLPVGLTQPLGWAVTLDGVVMLAWLGVVTVGVAYALYGFGLRSLPTSTAVTLTLAEPVTAALLGVLVLDERLAPLGWVGAALVVLGLALTARRPVTAVPE
ncbi:MAG: EamA family transporter [Ilumatobacteraceae bacterium]